MDNYADRYRSFLDGNDDELTVIVEKYQYGLTLYINGIVKEAPQFDDLTMLGLKYFGTEEEK